MDPTDGNMNGADGSVGNGPGGGPGDGPGDGYDPGMDAGFGLGNGVRVFSRSDAAAIDRACAEEFGLPTLVLMEHASSQLTEATVRLLSILGGSTVLVVCGPGQNGGDGLASARQLDAMDIEVAVVLAGSSDAVKGDAAVQLSACTLAGVEVIEIDDAGAIDEVLGDAEPAVVIDALFGTGLSRAPEGVAAALIDRINEMGAEGATIVSADVPSGMDCDSGGAVGACVRADLTVTFAGLKRGFLELGAQEWLGEVVVAPIGAPGVVLRRFGEAAEAGWADRFGREFGADDDALSEAPGDGSRGAGLG